MTRVTSDIEAIQVLFQQGLVNMWLQVCTLDRGRVADVLDEHRRSRSGSSLGVVPAMTLLTVWFRSAVRPRLPRGARLDRGRDVATSRRTCRARAWSRRTTASRTTGVKHANIVGEYRKANLYTAHIGGVYGPGAQFVGVLAQAMVVLIGGQHGARRHAQLRRLRRVQPLPHPPVRADPAARAALQHLPAGPAPACSKLRELFSTNPSVREKPDAQ